MAVAAYASLLSLSHVLDNLQHPAHLHRLSLDTNQIQTLQEKLHFLHEFLEIYDQRKSNEIEDFVREIAVVADEAGYVIDLHVVDQLRCKSDEDLSSFCDDVDRVIQKIDSIREEVILVKESWNDVEEQRLGVSVPAGLSSAPPPIDNNTMVGFDEHLVRVMAELTTDEANLQVIPIVGMGGIGKTTLARNVFGHPYIVEHFHKRIWFTISQEYSVREILIGLLYDGKNQGVSNEYSTSHFGEILYKSLFGEKYLVVMDDMWSIEAFDDLKFFFPNNGNGSRIMVTTRLSEVAVSLGSHDPYLMSFLDEEKSWKLFCEKAYRQEGCPHPELEKIGRDIAKSCRGLPLAIVVIGGLLAKTNMTHEHWYFVAKNVNSFANSEDDGSCLNILSLSYNNLPLHLKPCFLYMRVFPEDSEITVSKLIKLWVAEGFLKPIRNKSLEEAAEYYLKDLVSRNLILIGKMKYSGKTKTCRIHDLIRDLCLRESHKEHVHVPKAGRLDLTRGKNVCSICSCEPTNERMDLLEVFLHSRSTLHTNTLLCDTCKIMHSCPNRLRLVRVMEVNLHSSKKILQHTRSQYVEVKTWDELFVFSPTLHLLWNLQTLYFDASSPDNPRVLPSEIWEVMPQLRHLEVCTATILLDHVVTQIERKDYTTMVNLQTLSFVRNFRCTQEVIERIPNLKKLKIFYTYEQFQDWSFYSLQNLAHLHKLESLCFRGDNIVLEYIAFPRSLKKLDLWWCGIPWKHMTVIGSLPNLEVLKLYDNAFKGLEWIPIEGEFLVLKLLLIEFNDLVWWRAEDVHFPNLETLVLKGLYSLVEIPLCIGDIATLHSIHLHYCSNSVIESAEQILEEQQSFGNESLQVHVIDAERGQYQLGAYLASPCSPQKHLPS